MWQEHLQVHEEVVTKERFKGQGSPEGMETEDMFLDMEVEEEGASFSESESKALPRRSVNRGSSVNPTTSKNFRLALFV